MDDTHLTEEELRKVTEGEAAASLLESPAYLLAIERVRSQCAEGILRSAPGDTAQREHLYNLSRGLAAVTEELVSIQSEGQAIAENATRSTPGTDDTDLFQEETGAEY
ncbi:hypothetical protein [Novosphingobium panipatense]|uniref:Terminase small subunit n=1 Tax=Novosphingobium panipatense TaxID=428991 RepID=A0ABY1Q6X6_9SPHN|nr:hypothetical protein [Novosphingobium panipatense]SMP58374.1 hypothetical protein SAMN06296065_102459 [Novosphingobium panipatense]